MIEFIVDGKKVIPPENWQGLEIELSFENENPSASVDIQDFSYVKENADTLNNWLLDGIDGSDAGIYEGVPFVIEARCDGIFETAFDGFIDLSAEETQFSCDRVLAPIVERGQIDFLNEAAEGFTFAYLASLSGRPGAISPSDYQPILYTLTSIPDGPAVAAAALGSYIIIKEINETIKRLVDVISSLTVPITGIAIVIIKLIAVAIYLIAVIIALIVMIKRLVESLVSFPRQFNGMSLKKHFEKGAAYLGLGFSSGILNTTGSNNDFYSFGSDYENTMIMPRKTEKGKICFTAPTDEGFYDKTFAQFIRDVNLQFNAKVKIINNILHWEREDFFEEMSTFVIPNVEKDFFKTSASEVNSNTLLEYRLDNSELNTYDKPDGRLLQVTIEPSQTPTDQKAIMLKNANLKRFAFAQTSVKETSSLIDRTLVPVVDNISLLINTFQNGVGDLLDSFSSLIGNSPGTGNSKTPAFTCELGSRLGFMEVERDFIGVPKLLIFNNSNNKPASNSRSLLSARTLWDNFHSVSSPVPSEGRPLGNQWKIFETGKGNDPLTIPLCCTDFISLKNKNMAKTSDNEDAKITSLIWNPFKESAKIKYRINTKFTSRIKQTLTP